LVDDNDAHIYVPAKTRSEEELRIFDQTPCTKREPETREPEAREPEAWGLVNIERVTMINCMKKKKKKENKKKMMMIKIKMMKKT